MLRKFREYCCRLLSLMNHDNGPRPECPPQSSWFPKRGGQTNKAHVTQPGTDHGMVMWLSHLPHMLFDDEVESSEINFQRFCR